jgi:hypothetical protein
MVLGTMWLSACSSSDGGGSCSPPGFVTCRGNDIVTCEGAKGAAEGTTKSVDCTATGQFCLGVGFDSARLEAMGYRIAAYPALREILGFDAYYNEEERYRGLDQAVSQQR